MLVIGFTNVTASFVEFETSPDLKTAVEKLDNREFKGSTVHCVADVRFHSQNTNGKVDKRQEQPETPFYHRGRSRSPPRRGGGYGPPADEYYGRRGPPPRGYSPRRDGYRRRTPPRDDYYGSRRGYDSPPPVRAPRGPPPDDYAPPRGGYRDDPYARPPPGRYDDPYAAGYERGPRPRSPPRGYGGYDESRRAYW